MSRSPSLFGTLLGLEIVLRWWVSPTGLSFQLLPAGAVRFLMNGGTFSSSEIIKNSSQNLTKMASYENIHKKNFLFAFAFFFSTVSRINLTCLENNCVGLEA
jgi:hypothetical protein